MDHTEELRFKALELAVKLQVGVGKHDPVEAACDADFFLGYITDSIPEYDDDESEAAGATIN